MKLFRVLEIVFPVIAMLSLGFFARRKGIVSREGAEGIKSLVLNITLPMVIFNALYRVQVDETLLWYIGAGLLASFLGLLLGKLAVKPLHTHPALPFLTCCVENSMLGFPLFVLLFGAENLSHMVLINISNILFVYVVVMPRAQAYSGMGKEGTLKRIVSSPALQALVLALVLSLTGWGRKLDATAFGPVVSGVTEFISRPTSGAILFAVGYDIKLTKEYLKDAAVAAGVRLCIMAVLLVATLAGLGQVVDIPQYRRYAYILLFMMPTALVVPMFFKREEDVAYLATCNSFYVLLTVGMYTILTAAVA